jgi:hypothetical protein
MKIKKEGWWALGGGLLVLLGFFSAFFLGRKNFHKDLKKRALAKRRVKK